MLACGQEENIAVTDVKYAFVKINRRLGLVEKDKLVKQKLRSVLNKIIRVNICIDVVNALKRIYIEIVWIKPVNGKKHRNGLILFFNYNRFQ